MNNLDTDSRGNTLFVEPNEVGGHRYWSDEIGGGVMVWDTSLVSSEMLELALKQERKRNECMSNTWSDAMWTEVETGKWKRDNCVVYANSAEEAELAFAQRRESLQHSHAANNAQFLPPLELRIQRMTALLKVIRENYMQNAKDGIPPMVHIIDEVLKERT